MKFGLLVEHDTRNIGDDIQAYAAKKFLPQIDYYIDRNHIDEFIPKKNEFVATILNGWFLQYTLNWPLSPYIKPLPISMHFTTKNWFWDTTDRDYHLQGYGLEYLKSIEPIGCRDKHTVNLLNSKGINTEYTGCMTLTLDKFEGIEKGDYICAVDVSEEVVDKIKRETNSEVKIITHTVPEDYYKLAWSERMNNVEKLLKTYQGAKAVVTFRLHCALPCLALGTPVILLNEDYRNDRFGDYTKYVESCSETEFLSNEKKYDYNNIPKHNDDWKMLRNNLVERCNNFINQCQKNDFEYKKTNIDVENYREYVVKKSNWLKKATNESYRRFEECRRNVKELEDQKKELEDQKKELEENFKKIEDEIDNMEHERNYYKKEFEDCVKKMEAYRDEIEAIKSSRWWKIRAKIKHED